MVGKSCKKRGGKLQ
jgi:hypothetical protein